MFDVVLPYPEPGYPTPDAASEAMRSCSRYFLSVSITEYWAALKSYQDKLKEWRERRAGMAELDFSAEPIQPLPPVMGWDCSTGLGKSHQLREMAAQHIRQARSDSDGSTVVIFVPTHKLGAEQVEKFNAEHPELVARRFLGISQDDPEMPDKKMCHRHEVVADLCKDGASMRDLCAKPRLKAYCPHHVDAAGGEGCGYSKQANQSADVWFLPQQMLFSTPPACVGTPSLVGIDESFWQASLEGFSSPYRLRLETLIADRGFAGAGDLTALMLIAELVYDSIIRFPDGFLDCKEIAVYLGDLGERRSPPEYCKLAHRLEMKRLKDVKVTPDMSGQQLEDKLGKLQSLSIMRLAKFWELLEKEVAAEGISPHIEKRTVQDREGSTIWLYLYDRKAIHADWQVPTVIIDATLPVEINKTFFPQLKVDEFHCPMQHTTVTQIQDKTLSKAMMLPTDSCGKRKQAERGRNVERLIDLCRVLVSRICGVEPVKVLLITSKDLEERLLEAGLPDGMETMHLGAVSGMDAYKDVPCIVMAGRLEMPLRVAEHQASVLKGEMVERVPDSDKAWFLKKLSGIETTENVIGVPATYHPDPLVEEVRWSWNEGQLIQAIGRGRAVRRTADNPLELYVLTNVPLPIVADHVVDWADVVPCSVEQVLAQHGVVPISYNEMVRIKPDVWRSKGAAERAVEKFIARYREAATSGGNHGRTNPGPQMPIYINYRQNETQMRLYKTLLLIEYTRDVKGAKPCRAVICKGHGFESGKKALINLVGRIKHYRIICAVQSTNAIYPPKIKEPTELYFNSEFQRWVSTKQNTALVCGMTSTNQIYYSTKLLGAKR